MCQGFMSFTVSPSLLKVMSIESVMPSNYLILSAPSFFCPQSFPNQDLFQRVGSSHQVAKVLELLLQQVRWSGYSHLFQNFPQFIVIYTVKGFSLVNEAEVDVFLEFPSFFYDPTDVDNLVSGSSAFSKSSLYIWKFSVHWLLKPSLKAFEHYLASVWNECNCEIVWTSFGIALFWN